MVLKKLLLTGGTGRLGKFIVKNINLDKYLLLAPTSKELDITNRENVTEFLNRHKPDLIVHSAAYTDVKKIEKDYLKAININVIGTINLLNYAIEKKIDFVYISTDAVFDGKKGNYKPTDSLNPLNKYAKTKTAAELTCRTYEKTTVIRTAFFEYDFPYDTAFYDQYTSKDYLDIIGPKIINVINNYKPGIYHVGGDKQSVYDIAIKRKPEVIKDSKNNFNYIILEDTSFDEYETKGDL